MLFLWVNDVYYNACDTWCCIRHNDYCVKKCMKVCYTFMYNPSNNFNFFHTPYFCNNISDKYVLCHNFFRSQSGRASQWTQCLKH